MTVLRRTAWLPGACLILASCGGSHATTPSVSASVLNTLVVERAISQSIATQRHVSATVACPHPVPQAAGVAFSCLAELPHDVTTAFVVTESGTGGHVSYVGCRSGLGGCGSVPLGARVLDAGRVQRAIRSSIRSRRHVGATVTCPSAVPSRTGFQFDCVARTGATNTPFAVTETDASGHVSYVGQ